MTCLLTQIVKDLELMNHNGGETVLVIDNVEYNVYAEKHNSFFTKKLKSINIKLKLGE